MPHMGHLHRKMSQLSLGQDPLSSEKLIYVLVGLESLDGSKMVHRHVHPLTFLAFVYALLFVVLSRDHKDLVSIQTLRNNRHLHGAQRRSWVLLRVDRGCCQFYLFTD